MQPAKETPHFASFERRRCTPWTTSSDKSRPPFISRHPFNIIMVYHTSPRQRLKLQASIFLDRDTSTECVGSLARMISYWWICEANTLQTIHPPRNLLLYTKYYIPNTYDSTDAGFSTAVKQSYNINIIIYI